MMYHKEPIRLRKVRDFSGSISVTFDFLRENFKSLYKSLLMIAGGIMILTYTAGFGLNMLLGLGEEPPNQDPEVFDEFALEDPAMELFGNDFIISNIVLIYVVGFISTLVVIAITYRYLMLYPQHGKDISPAFLWSYVRRDFWHMLMATFVFFLLMALCAVAIGVSATTLGWFVGFLLMCLFLYFIIPVSLIHIIVMAEKVNPITAIKRSFYLIQGNWWSTFGVMFITSLIIYVVSMAIYLPATVLGFAVSFNSLQSPDISASDNNFMSMFTIAFTLLYSMSFFFSLPVSYLALAFQYFSLVESKEHIGLIERIETIGEKQV